MLQNDLVEIPRYSERARQSTNFATQRRLATLEALSYQCFASSAAQQVPSEDFFTLAIIVFDGNPDYVEASLKSMYAQTYPFMEFILIDNGTTGHIRALVDHYASSDPRTKTIRVDHNYFAPELPDESNPWPNLVNAALFVSTGRYFFCLSYDDHLSDNYAQCMVDLFKANPACTSAAPGVASIGPSGEINVDRTEVYRASNNRSAYIPGIDIARGLMRDERLFVAPGEVLAILSQVAIDRGGIDVMNDVTQMLRLAVTGESGFDASATLYWRHHPEQTNKYLTSRGQIYYRDYISMDERYRLSALYAEEFSAEDVQLLKRYIQHLAVDQGTLKCIQLSSAEYGLIAGGRALTHALQQCPADLRRRCIGTFVRSTPRAAITQAARLASWGRTALKR